MPSTDSNTVQLIPPHYLDGVAAVATAARGLYQNGPSFADASANLGVCNIVGMVTLAEYTRDKIRGRALVIAKREYPKIRWANPIFPIPGGAGAYYNCETRWSSRRRVWRLAYARCIHLACIDFIEAASYKVGMIDGDTP